MNDVAEEYLERDRSTKPSPLHRYRSVRKRDRLRGELGDHFRHGLGRLAPGDVTAAHIDRWLHRMKANRTTQAHQGA